jgi:hypothetical protein
MKNDKQKNYHIPVSARGKNLDNIRLFLTYKKVRTEISNIRKEFKVTPDGMFDFNRMPEYAMRVTELCRYHRLPDNFDKYVSKYILCGKISAPMTNFNLIPKLDNNEGVDIRIFTKLTIDECKDLAKELEIVTGLTSYQPLKNITKKLQSEDLYTEVKRQNQNPDKEYTQTIKEMSGRRRAKIAYENMRELRELREKRFGK